MGEDQFMLAREELLSRQKCWRTRRLRDGADLTKFAVAGREKQIVVHKMRRQSIPGYIHRHKENKSFEVEGRRV